MNVCSSHQMIKNKIKEINSSRNIFLFEIYFNCKCFVYDIMFRELLLRFEIICYKKSFPLPK